MELIYAVQNAFRRTLTLNGPWHIALDQNNSGWEKAIPKGHTVEVPSHMPDNFIDAKWRHVDGLFWMERRFYLPKDWLGEPVWLHVGALGRRGTIYVNGTEVGQCETPFVPTTVEVTRQLHYGEENTIICKISSVPTVYDLLQRETPIGILGPVYITQVPRNHLEKAILRVDELSSERAVISYRAIIKGNCMVTALLRDRDGRVVATSVGGHGQFIVENPHIWNIGKGYVYYVDFDVNRIGHQQDQFTLPFGIRRITEEQGQLYLNGNPLRLQGIRLPAVGVQGTLRDHVYIRRWMERVLSMGGNCVFTGGYPLSEEVLSIADQLGLLVIYEMPVSLLETKRGHQSYYSQGDVKARILPYHIRVIEQLVEQRRHHPCIVGWSLLYQGGEMTADDAEYMHAIIDVAKHYDGEERPVWMTTQMSADQIDSSIVSMWSGLIVQLQPNVNSSFLREWQRAYPQLPIIATIPVLTVDHRTSPGEQVEQVDNELQRYWSYIDSVASVSGELISFTDTLHGPSLQKRWKK